MLLTKYMKYKVSQDFIPKKGNNVYTIDRVSGKHYEIRNIYSGRTIIISEEELESRFIPR